MTRSRIRALVACLAALAVVLPLAWMWQASRLPATYSVMDMGYLDYGGGPAGPMAGHQHMHHAGTAVGAGVSVPDLDTGTTATADVTVDLVADKRRFTLASGREIDGYTLNGSSPGPLIEATEGDLVEVHVRNRSVPDGITVHWHGVDVPNAEDGVAGVTQDAVGVGQSYTYRFVAEDAGSYWYHSHQVSHAQVVGGLFGPLVVHPDGDEEQDTDVVALTHLYQGVRTINGEEGDVPAHAAPGSRVRVRLINTDNGPAEVWSNVPYRVLAVDGRDLHEPTPVQGKSLTLTAGGRADLEVTVPDDGTAAEVQIGGSALLVGPPGAAPADVAQPDEDLDLLHYGSPAPLGFDPGRATRTFDYSIGRRPGFVRGRPGVWWSINGHLFPDIPMFVVREGDIVVMRIENHSGDVHPMHLHGHHAVVLSRDGERSTGSPWWVDSLNVRDDETYEIAFVADNPGVWMDHCHNLQHAVDGLVAHLMYEGVSTPYRIGGASGNQPE